MNRARLAPAPTALYLSTHRGAAGALSSRISRQTMPLIRRTATAALALTLALSGCVQSHGTPRPNRPWASDLISAEEIQSQNWGSVYDIVQQLHPSWLSDRGTDTLNGEKVEVMAHLDNTRLGPATMLREIPAMNVMYIQHVDGIAAAARWGLGYSHGAIIVGTREKP